jgi:hypothetical protein
MSGSVRDHFGQQFHEATAPLPIVDLDWGLVGKAL